MVFDVEYGIDIETEDEREERWHKGFVEQTDRIMSFSKGTYDVMELINYDDIRYYYKFDEQSSGDCWFYYDDCDEQYTIVGDKERNKELDEIFRLGVLAEIEDQKKRWKEAKEHEKEWKENCMRKNPEWYDKDGNYISDK